MKETRIKIDTEEYPDRLNNLYRPPKQLFYIGKNLNEQLSGPSLGIVGSRKVTAYGRSVTEKFSFYAAKKGVSIVSGLALGVDSIAHKSALEAKGKTIAVLPGGLGNIYPSSHRILAKQIIENNGTLVSEFEHNFTPRKESFIMRNRIIAGLSNALLITEAAERSGSLHTARFALELGIPVLAVPGNINQPNSEGTNNLIKAGATAITNEDDLISILGLENVDDNQEIYGDDEFEATVIKLIKQGIYSADEMLLESSFDIARLQQTLTMLEIKGVIVPIGNNNWQLK